MQKIIGIALLWLLFLPTHAQQKAENIILLIGDGMGLAQISAAMVRCEGQFNFSRFSHMGFVNTYSSDDYVTDSGASATAMATGKKTYKGAISVDVNKETVKTVLEIAEDNGKATGLIATSSITHATPAAFIAHNADRNKQEEIAVDFLDTEFEVIIGGGRDYFEKRKDNLNLSDNLIQKGYEVVYAIDDISDGGQRTACFLAEQHLPKISEGRGDMLLKATSKAISKLCIDENGFFLMVESSQIDWGGHDRDLEYIVLETLDFNKAIGAALDFAEKDGTTLVIVTADHETGGLALTGGDINKKQIEGKFATKDHTGILVPLFAYGPGSVKFAGIYENTAIFDKIVEACGFE